MFCVALTGTIASGKSTVAQIFAEYSIPVISADAIAKEITQKGAVCYQPIIDYFGDSAVIPETGELDRKFLRKQIFADANKREWLESLMHPHIRIIIQQRVSTEEGPYCIVEIPLLLDRKTYPYIQRVLLVLAEKSVQIQRIQARDGISVDEALAILKAQPNVTTRRKIADDILYNNCSKEELRIKISHLHQKYLLLAAS